MKERKWIIRGVYISYLSFFLRQGFVFIITPVLVGFLGSAGYGLWAVLGSVQSYIGMLNVGFGSTTTRYIAKYHATGERDAINWLVSSLLIAIAIIGLLIMLVCLGLMPFIPAILNIPAGLVSAGRIAFMVMGFNVALLLLGDVVIGIIYGFQRVDVYKTFTIVKTVSNALFTVLLLNMGVGLVGVAVAASLSVLVLIVASSFFIHRQKYGILIRPRFAKLSVIKGIAPYGVRTFVLSLTNRFLFNSANIIISIFLGVAFVTRYSIAYRLCFITLYLHAIITEAVSPRFTKLYTLGDFEGLKKLYLKVAKLCIIIVVPIVLTLAICGWPFINLWVGPENLLGMNAFMVLVLFSIPQAVAICPFTLLQAIGQNKGSMISEIINAALNLSISIVLVRSIGLLGISIGTLAASLLSSFWIMPLLAAKHIGLSAKKYLLSCILPPLLVSIPAGLVSWFLIGNLIPNTNIVLVLLKAFLIFVTCFGLYLLIGARQDERRMYLRLLPRIVGTAKG